ncbi:hypothetical protein U0358_06505 [Idiomarina sp. PL1-037]|uniref:hypothetical protein n=1 Tax=Idiomarina sp. PL1-037 TaxID=3095365 RepID=UPI002ACBF8E4|nr:hypothetical protein [Idiomarina sp. PL1-037]WQC54201.1 hypothetical protein U0358_06505 [Idiomarina sp. PL1-037]
MNKRELLHAQELAKALNYFIWRRDSAAEQVEQIQAELDKLASKFNRQLEPEPRP